MEVPAFDHAGYDVLADALAILSRAKQMASYRILDEVHGHGRAHDAMETWRWVANAYDHVQRAQRVVLGLDRRGDPCLPEWAGLNKEVVR